MKEVVVSLLKRSLLNKVCISPSQLRLLLYTMKLQPWHQDLEPSQGSLPRHRLNAQPTISRQLNFMIHVLREIFIGDKYQIIDLAFLHWFDLVSFLYWFRFLLNWFDFFSSLYWFNFLLFS